MKTLMDTLTFTHVMAGIISLVAAPIALIVFKGGSAHRITGKIFFWAMTWIFVTAIVISIYKSIPFLLMIAVFSYYSVVVAYRSLYQKQIISGKGIKWYDWFALVTSGIFNFGCVVWGIFNAIQSQQGFLAYLAIGFGIGGLIIVIGQLKIFTTPPTDKHWWLYNHIGNMTGGFIASVTAFSANILVFLPGVVQWIWPSIVGVPLIFYWISRYRRKLNKGVQHSTLFEFNSARG